MLHTLILGAGGHAQVIADILMRAREAGAQVDPIGYLDDNPHIRDQTRLGLPILGSLVDISRIAHDAVIIGIGHNGTRQRLFDRLCRAGERFAIARHPSAIVAPDVPLGMGSVICAGAIVNTGSIIGANVILNTACSVDHHNIIGDHAHIAPGVHLGGDVHIGAGTLVGIGAIVMPQRQVGNRSTVGAGALVCQNIPDDAIAIGVPARIKQCSDRLLIRT